MYRTNLKCFRSSTVGKNNICHSDLVSLPENQAGILLDKFNSEEPVFFCVKKYKDKNTDPKNIAHLKIIKNYQPVFCRVADFTQEKNIIILPDWMMNTCDLENEDVVTIAEVRMCKGKTISLEPHDKAMMEMFNSPESKDLSVVDILSPLMSRYGCITNNSEITLELFGVIWKLNVKDAKSDDGKDKKGIIVMNVDLQTNLLPALNDIPLPIMEEEVLETNNVMTFNTSSDKPKIESEDGFKAFKGDGNKVCEDTTNIEINDRDKIRLARLKAMGL